MKKRLLTTLVFVILFIAFNSITVSAHEAKNEELSYVIEEGTRYYESSFEFGSGRSGIVSEENIYTDIPCYAGINGYSFLDAEGRIIESKYDESANDILIPEAPEGTAQIFKHFKTTDYRNGWVNAESVKLKNKTENEVKTEPKPDTYKEEAKPEEVVERIQEDTKKGLKTAVVIDYSGSMSEHQRKVVELLAKLEFDENTTIIAFATTFEVITTEQLANNDFYVGAETHMYQALNKATSMNVSQMIIISDLQTYNDVKLDASESLKNVIIYDPLGYDMSYVEKELKEAWKNSKINRTVIK